jgi:hypothetical protein
MIYHSVVRVRILDELLKRLAEVVKAKFPILQVRERENILALFRIGVDLGRSLGYLARLSARPPFRAPIQPS